MRPFDQHASGSCSLDTAVCKSPAELESEAWQAQLTLEIEQRAGRSVLTRSAHVGPLRVQRAFYPESHGSCHVYVLHPPGGIVSGDVLALNVDARVGASVLLTTPGATKLYRARARDQAADAQNEGRAAQLSQSFRAAQGAAIEWLPQDTIAFNGSQVRIATEVELAADAIYAGWDILCLGRPAARELFTQGHLRNAWTIKREGTLRFVERALYAGGDTSIGASWGLRHQPVVGTFLIAAPNACSEWVELVRAELGDISPTFAVTLVSGTFVARYLGGSTLDARAIFERVFRLLRPHYLGRPAVFPRIWHT